LTLAPRPRTGAAPAQEHGWHVAQRDAGGSRDATLKFLKKKVQAAVGRSRARATLSCSIMFIQSPTLLTKRERKSLNTGIQEFDLKSPVFYPALLPD
jgi:hypothetical protein